MTTETTTNGQQATEAPAEPEPRAVVPADGVWARIELMGRTTIAGRVSPDRLLGGGTVLVEIPEMDGVTLREAQTFQPSGSALYRARWCTRPAGSRLPVPADPDSLCADGWQRRSRR